MSRLYNTGDGKILSGSTNGRLDTTNYGGPIGRLTPETLIESVSEVLDIAHKSERDEMRSQDSKEVYACKTENQLSRGVRPCACNPLLGALSIISDRYYWLSSDCQHLFPIV